jgi:hypothetical protein
VLPFTHPQSCAVDICCYNNCWSLVERDSRFQISVSQTNSSGPSVPLWRSNLTASSRSALMSSGVGHVCVCGCLFVFKTDCCFCISICTSDIDCHIVRNVLRFGREYFDCRNVELFLGYSYQNCQIPHTQNTQANSRNVIVGVLLRIKYRMIKWRYIGKCCGAAML